MPPISWVLNSHLGGATSKCLSSIDLLCSNWSKKNMKSLYLLVPFSYWLSLFLHRIKGQHSLCALPSCPMQVKCSAFALSFPLDVQVMSRLQGCMTPCFSPAIGVKIKNLPRHRRDLRCILLDIKSSSPAKSTKARKEKGWKEAGVWDCREGSKWEGGRVQRWRKTWGIDASRWRVTGGHYTDHITFPPFIYTSERISTELSHKLALASLNTQTFFASWKHFYLASFHSQSGKIRGGFSALLCRWRALLGRAGAGGGPQRHSVVACIPTPAFANTVFALPTYSYSSKTMTN